MSKRTDQEFLSDIREALQRITTYIVGIMAGARDRLIHHYFGINLDIVWHIVTIELPEVASQLETTKDEGK